MIAATLAFTALVTCSYLYVSNYPTPQFIGTTVHRVTTQEKMVALTYDDGPKPPYTSEILEILKKHEVHATFFVLGKQAQQHPGLIKQIYTQGHELGNHAWDHYALIFKKSAYIRDQIDRTDKLLRELGYSGPIHFRAPYGKKLWSLPKILKKQHRPHILWDVTLFDWKKITAEKMAADAVKKIRPGSIILLHDGLQDRNYDLTESIDHSQTVRATELIITALKKHGYRFVTISELLAEKNRMKKHLAKH